MTSLPTFKKGNALIEGAIIFPLILLAMLFLITTSRFLLIEVLTQATLSQDVLAESIALSYSGQIEVNNTSNITKEKKGIFDGISGDSEVFMVKTRFFKNSTMSYFHDFKYVINEMEYIRWIDQLTKEDQQ